MKKVFSIISGVILFSQTIFSQIGGSSVFPFLRLPNSARAEALGGIANAIWDSDVSLALQNPAMLNYQMHNHLTLNFVDYFGGIVHGFAGYGRHYDNVGTFYTGIQFVNYGTFVRADESGNTLGTFTAGDYAFNFGGGKMVTEDSLFSVGINTKFIYSQMEEYVSLGGGIDLGAAYLSKSKRFIATLQMLNFGTQFKTYSGNVREPLPFEIRAGVSSQFEHLPLRLSIVAHSLQKPDLTFTDPNREPEFDLTGQEIVQNFGLGNKIMRHFIFGAELMPIKDVLYLRLGYNFQRRQEMKVNVRPGTVGIAWGLGLRLYKININYSRAAYHIAGSPNNFTLSTNLSEFFPVKEKKLKI